MSLIQYLRHVIEDWHRRVGFRHFISDFHRFLATWFPSQPVSFPPHPLQFYRELLQDLRNHPRCVFRSLKDHVRNAPVDIHQVNVVLRHDLDAGNPEIAQVLCDVESALGLRSSVHILVDGTLYNPARLVPLARGLHGGGFDVGLHTQAWMHEDYASAFRADLCRFEDVFGFAPATFTQHGAWPRTARDMKRRHEFTRRTPELIAGTSIIGYNNSFDWVSEDSNIRGQPAPIRSDFFQVMDRCYLGGVALILTHDAHWKV